MWKIAHSAVLQLHLHPQTQFVALILNIQLSETAGVVGVQRNWQTDIYRIVYERRIDEGEARKYLLSMSDPLLSIL